MNLTRREVNVDATNLHVELKLDCEFNAGEKQYLECSI
jgi:hypothetical protein